LDKLFDHLVSEREQSRRNLDAERFRGPLNDRDLKFGGHNGQTCWLFATQNRPATYLTISIAEAHSVACQPPKDFTFGLDNGLVKLAWKIFETSDIVASDSILVRWLI
jgi:hypothetical protein